MLQSKKHGSNKPGKHVLKIFIDGNTAGFSVLHVWLIAVFLFQVEDSDEVAEGADPAWRPGHAVPGPPGSRSRYSTAAEAHAQGSGGPAGGMSWGTRQTHPQHAAAGGGWR